MLFCWPMSIKTNTTLFLETGILCTCVCARVYTYVYVCVCPCIYIYVRVCVFIVWWSPMRDMYVNIKLTMCRRFPFNFSRVFYWVEKYVFVNSFYERYVLLLCKELKMINLELMYDIYFSEASQLSQEIRHYVCGRKKTFLQDFLEIRKLIVLI